MDKWEQFQLLASPAPPLDPNANDGLWNQAKEGLRRYEIWNFLSDLKRFTIGWWSKMEVDTRVKLTDSMRGFMTL